MYKIYISVSLILLICLNLSFKNQVDEIIIIPSHFPKVQDSLKNEIKLEGIELGRELFYDSILSENYSISCNSCHKQEFAFSDGLTSNPLNKSPFKRNTPALFNLIWSKSFGIDGKNKTIEKQILDAVENPFEMNLNWEKALKRLKKSKYDVKFKSFLKSKKLTKNDVSNVISQFIYSLISSNSKFDRVINGEEHFTNDEYQGFVLINDQTKGNCLHCHPIDGNALTTNFSIENNGLSNLFLLNNFNDNGLYNTSKKENDLGKFKTPSLRNLVFTAPYMHDGRFQTLEEVIDFYSEKVNHTKYTSSKMSKDLKLLTTKEKKQIISFLKTMSDSTFITNTNYKRTLKK